MLMDTGSVASSPPPGCSFLFLGSVASFLPLVVAPYRLTGHPPCVLHVLVSSPQAPAGHRTRLGVLVRFCYLFGITFPPLLFQPRPAYLPFWTDRITLFFSVTEPSCYDPVPWRVLRWSPSWHY